MNGELVRWGTGTSIHLNSKEQSLFLVWTVVELADEWEGFIFSMNFCFIVHFKLVRLIFRSFPKVVLKAKSLELFAICLNSECTSEAFNQVYCFQPLKRNKNYLSLMKLILQAVSQYVSVARHSAVLNY